MKTLQQELIDFLIKKSRNFDIALYKSASELAEEFCKSINSHELVERRAIGENEQKEKNCEHEPILIGAILNIGVFECKKCLYRFSSQL